MRWPAARGTSRVRREDQSQIQRSQTGACGRSDQIRYELRRKNSDTDQIRYSAPFFFFNQIRPDTARDPPVRDANGWHSPPPKHLPSPCFREGTHWPIQWLIWLAAHPPGWQLAGPQRGPNAQDDNHLDAAFAAAAVPSSFSSCSCCCSFPCFFFLNKLR